MVVFREEFNWEKYHPGIYPIATLQLSEIAYECYQGPQVSAFQRLTSAPDQGALWGNLGCSTAKWESEFETWTVGWLDRWLLK